MKIIQLVVQVIVLYVIYLIGTWLQKTFQLLIPGSMIGMLLLLVLLFTRTIQVNWIQSGATLLLAYLPLLFLPVTVGVITFLDLLKGEGMIILLIVFISTFIVLVSTARMSQWLIQKGCDDNE